METLTEMDGAPIRKIIKLDDTVINRIAAGEVVQRPANAIKELIENCIDAKSTSIQITIKDGGLKLLQIQDNGTGIRKEDLDIVCERFTTSKLTSFDDLKTIATYGFRGEALSSISHVAHVTIRTRTADAQCAMQVTYTDGKPKGPPKPCAGNLGTIITVEDLFYNVPVRRKVITSPAAEFAKIADVVSRYAVHNSSIGFSLKKHGDTVSTIKTMPYSTIAVNIKLIYGADVAKELLDISAESHVLKFKLNGFITKFDYGGKKTTLLLFINNRLVESAAIRKSIESVYSAYLNKNTFPFVYLSLQIAPQNVDVNVHPTKEEVLLLHQAEIMEEIQKVMETRLMTTSQCRKFYTQTLLPQTRSDNVDQSQVSGSPSSNSDRVYQNKMVRTDHREQKLDAFFSQPSVESPRQASSAESFQVPINSNPEQGGVTAKPTLATTAVSGETEPVRHGLELDSVLDLFRQIKEQCSSAHRAIFQNLTFVGCVSREMSLIQHETNLYLLNVKKLSERLFYQIMIKDFGKFGILRLSEPASIHDLVVLALDTSGYDGECGSTETLATCVVDKLKSNAAMLKEYFSMEIDEEGKLLSIPYLLEKYTPDMVGLPMYILRLSTEVKWESEQECFETFCKETSRFYAFSTTDYDTESAVVRSSSSDPLSPPEFLQPNAAEPKWKWTVEHVLFSAFRSTFQPSRDDAENGSILKVANLDELYHVFERC